MQHNQNTATPETIPYEAGQMQNAWPGEVWFSDQRIAKDYTHATQLNNAVQNLGRDADSIQVVTTKDSLAEHLSSTIRQRTTTATTHTELATDLRAVPYIQQQKDWIFSIVLIAFILIASVRVGAPRFITELFQAIFSETKWNKTMESLKLQNRRASLQLFILYHLTAPLFIYEILVYQQINVFNQNNILSYLAILLAGLALFGIRTAGYWLLGYVFETRQKTLQFLQASLIFTNIAGLLILPISLLFPFIDPTYYQMLLRLGLSLFIVLYIWLISRGIKIILDDFLSIFYMFLYLCALEILPLLWLYKLFAG